MAAPAAPSPCCGRPSEGAGLRADAPRVARGSPAKGSIVAAPARGGRRGSPGPCGPPSLAGSGGQRAGRGRRVAGTPAPQEEEEEEEEPLPPPGRAVLSGAMAAEAVAARLARQEREVRGLAAEVARLKEAPSAAAAAALSPDRAGPELRALREENEKLRYRLLHLRRSLAAEQARAPAPRPQPAARQDLPARKGAAAPRTAERGPRKRSEPRAADGGQREAGGLGGAGPACGSAGWGRSVQTVPGCGEVLPGAISQLLRALPFIRSRLELYKGLKNESDALLRSRASGQSRTIRIALSDGKVVEGQAWNTTPHQIAVDLSQGVADSTVIARVNGELWDLDRPMEGDSTLELLTFENEDAQAVYWHSSAHILGEAMENYYGGYLCYGPPIENGFYYDMYMENRGVSSMEFLTLENICKNIIKEKQPFERLEVRKEDLLEMFKYNKFKCRILNEKIHTPTTTVYRCGPLIDLCKGPHVRDTGKIKALKIIKNSSTYWEGKANMETLQRIYGISFPEAKMMKEWERFQEEAKNRDHRKIGKEQELFFFHDLSPGNCFFLPRGAFVYNTLMDFIKEEYQRRNFTEVISPNIYNSKVWETSGHWQHYSENMFSFEVEKEIFALKPMNCPGHCLMFAHRPRSWREMPLRLADFGVLHRNELSGTLSGLTRVRRFQQDDAHLFCTMEQIEEEMKGCLCFLQSIYAVFGFTFQLHLSTRPNHFLGEKEIWDQAEKQLQNSLDDFGEPWKLNPGDGAFYGPKIDITIKDAIGRYHQCATIQLDFQLPIRFNLTYVGKDGNDKKRPIIIHRAILGSVERMIAILAENYGGKWPFWLSPRQVMVVPVGPTCEEYARQVCSDTSEAGFMADVDLDQSCTLNKKIRNAQLAQYNFIFVVGEKEKAGSAVNVRTRDNKVHGEVSVSFAIEKLRKLKASRTLHAEEEF